jgi:hypothetical protein
MSGPGKARLIAPLLAAMLLAWQEPAPIQPVPFSHKAHTAAGVKCLDCHPIRKPGFEAGFPKETACMGCHSTVRTESPAIGKLTEFYKSGKPVPWVKVYQMPDFVSFSHELHYRKAHIDCENCHGAVGDRDVIAREKPVSMNWCVGCHEKNKASVDCGVCHDIH